MENDTGGWPVPEQPHSWKSVALNAIALGGINLDTTMRVAAMPKPGETISGTSVSHDVGGKGLNQAVALHRAGAQVRLAGVMGTDAEAELIQQFLEAEGLVDGGLLQRVDAPTGRAFIVVDDSAENSIVVIPGANALPDSRLADNVAAALPDVDVLVANLELPLDLVTQAFRLAREFGVKTVLNPSPISAQLHDLLANTDLLVLNVEEAATLCEGLRSEPLEMARSLRSLGPKQVALTLGSQGCVYVDAAGAFAVPAQTVNAIDPTAAGDVFLAYLVAGQANASSAREACEWATRAAAACVQSKGATTAIPFRDQLTK